MNRRERLNDPTVALQDAIRGAMASAWTALPGIVQSFDPVAMTCVVQPAIKARRTQSSGAVVTAALP